MEHAGSAEALSVHSPYLEVLKADGTTEQVFSGARHRLKHLQRKVTVHRSDEPGAPCDRRLF